MHFNDGSGALSFCALFLCCSLFIVGHRIILCHSDVLFDPFGIYSDYL